MFLVPLQESELFLKPSSGGLQNAQLLLGSRAAKRFSKQLLNLSGAGRDRGVEWARMNLSSRNSKLPVPCLHQRIEAP